MVSIAFMHLGWSKSPVTPSTWLRSDGPTNKRSTSGTAAISLNDASAPAVSIWTPIKVSALARGVFGDRRQAKLAIAVATVQTTLAARPKLGPSHRLLDIRGRPDHADHHSAGSRLEGPHDRRVVGRRQPYEVIDAVASGRHGCELDFFHCEPGMLEVEPESVELTMFAQNFDQFGRQKLPHPEDPDQFALAEHLLDSWHPYASLTGTTIGEWIDRVSLVMARTQTTGLKLPGRSSGTKGFLPASTEG